MPSQPTHPPPLLMPDLPQHNDGNDYTDNSSLTQVDAHPDAPIPTAGQLELDDERSRPLPRFMQEQGAWKRWKWIPYPIRKFGVATVVWCKGPDEPTTYRIDPFFPAVQHAPLWLLDKYLPRRKHRIWLFIGYCVAWLLTFVLVMRKGLIVNEVENFGTPQDIGCGASYWSKGNGCGVDGVNCRPFNGTFFAFRCQANCANYKLLNPRAVGDQELNYQQLIVGGPSDATPGLPAVYRGDSFICGAAIHAGLMSNTKGGCGVVREIGQHSMFNASTRNGISSVGFNSYFPLSISFETDIDCGAQDVRWPLLAVSVTYTTVLSLFTMSAPVFFFPVFVGLFWQVGMASDAPNHDSIASLFSIILGRFLPAMFCAWVFYDKMGVRRTLLGLTAQIEKAVLWLGACWVGALTNYTLDWIPIQRLSGHDLEQQPGAKGALAAIVIIVFGVFVSQVWFLRQEGRLVRYLKLYSVFIASIIVCLFLPNLKLRIHHYILALLLLPGTSLQTRPSLLYQGLLVGLFINGIARWGFDSFLQTSYALQGDAQINSVLPVVQQPVIQLGDSVSNITFNWDTPSSPSFDGISVLVNDVERYRYYFEDGAGSSFRWSRNSSLGMDEYFRFGYLGGGSTYDYTRAGTWTSARSWNPMAAGPSKFKSRSLEKEISHLQARKP